MDFEDLDNSSPPPPDGEVAMQLVHLSNVRSKEKGATGESETREFILL
jgi:hypothetical protein